MARGTSKHTRQDALQDIPADRPGLPAPDSIQSIDTFVSPQNEEFKILHTTEVDAYDAPPKPKPKKARRPRTSG